MIAGSRSDAAPVDSNVALPQQRSQSESKTLLGLVRGAGVDSRWIVGAVIGLVVIAMLAGGIEVGLIVAVLVVATAFGVGVAVRVPYIGYIALMLAAPVLLTDIGGGLKVVHLLAAGAIAAAAIGLLVRGNSLRIPMPITAAIGFVALLGVSVITSTDPFASVFVYMNYLLGLALAMTVALVIASDRNALSWLLRAWIVGAAFAIVPTLAQGSAVTVRYGGALVEGRTSGIFAQPNDFGEFSLIAVFIGLALLLFARNNLDRLLAVVGIAMALYAVVESLSRGTWIGLAAGLVALGILIPRVGLWLVGMFAALGMIITGAALAGVGYAVGIAARAASVFDGSANPEDHRELIWTHAENLWFSNPIVGVGLGRFRSIARSTGSMIAPQGAYHAHNSVLQFGAESGVLAIVGLLILGTVTLVVALRVILTSANRHDRAKVGVVAALLSAYVAIFIHGFVDFVYTNPMLLMLAWLLFGILAGAMAMKSLPEPDAPVDTVDLRSERVVAS